MPRLFITDIDGTILNKGERTVNRTVLDFFSELSQSGIFVAVASGRSYDSISRVFEGEIPDYLYVISNDGALCTLGGKHLFGKPLSQSSCVHFFDEAKRHGSGFFCAADTSYLYGDEMRFSYAPEFAMSSKVTTSVYGIRENIYKIGIDTSVCKDSILCPSDVRCAYSDGILSEYISLYADKGTALEALSQRLFCNREDIFAVGDGANDTCMFNKAKYSALIDKVAKGQAPDCKKCMRFGNFGDVAEYYRNNFLNQR